MVQVPMLEPLPVLVGMLVLSWLGMQSILWQALGYKKKQALDSRL
jgi:hypothetical protein